MLLRGRGGPPGEAGLFRRGAGRCGHGCPPPAPRRCRGSRRRAGRAPVTGGAPGGPGGWGRGWGGGRSGAGPPRGARGPGGRRRPRRASPADPCAPAPPFRLSARGRPRQRAPAGASEGGAARCGEARGGRRRVRPTRARVTSAGPPRVRSRCRGACATPEPPLPPPSRADATERTEGAGA